MTYYSILSQNFNKTAAIKEKAYLSDIFNIAAIMANQEKASVVIPLQAIF